MSLPDPNSRRTALVTGASAGLGEELARCLARRGHNVVLVARRLDRLQVLADELESEHGIVAQPLACDLGDAQARAELLTAVERDVEILVNNAGFATSGAFQDTDPERQQQLARINVEAVVGLCGAYVPAMVRRGRGAVLNMASTTAFQPLPGNATYAASKAFVLSFTEGLHADLGGTGVTATALCPGPVRTDLWDIAGAEAGAAAGKIPSFVWTDAARVAEDGIRGLEHGKRVVVPGVANRFSTLTGQHIPRSVLLRISSLLPGA